MALVPGSRVTSARNGSPSTVPSWSDWVTWAIGKQRVGDLGRPREGGGGPVDPLALGGQRQAAAAVLLLDAGRLGGGGRGGGPVRLAARPAGEAARARARPSPSRAAVRHRVIAASSSPGLSSSASWPTTLKLLVEVDLDLAAVGEADLDAVGGAVVAGLGLQHGPAAGCGQGGGHRPVAGRAGQFLVAVAVGAGGGDPADHGHGQPGRGDPSGPALHRAALLVAGWSQASIGGRA